MTQRKPAHLLVLVGGLQVRWLRAGDSAADRVGGVGGALQEKSTSCR